MVILERNGTVICRTRAQNTLLQRLFSWLWWL
jgi:hypothetical protein